MTADEKRALMAAWMTDSSNELFDVFHECALKLSSAEADPREQMKQGVALLSTFILMSLFLVFIDARDRKGEHFEEKATAVKRYYTDTMNDMFNTYFNKHEYILSTKLGNT